MSAVIDESAEKPPEPVRRLCNEIQLFELCDLESCRHKDGRFCTDQDLLRRFEAIADVEDRPVEGRASDECDDDDEYAEGYDDAYDDESADDDYDEDR